MGAARSLGWSGAAGGVRGRTVRLLVIGVAMVGFIAATNRWVSWYTATHEFRLVDQINYRRMAEAAPGLLHHPIYVWHAQRFAVQWVVGSFAKLISLHVLGSYRIAFVLVVGAICVAMADLLARIRVSLAASAVCLGTLLLNVYLLRPVMIGPGDVGDLVFVLGTVFVARGLVLRDPVQLLAGLAVAFVARQTAWPEALVAAAAVLRDPGWAERLPDRRQMLAAAVVGLAAVLYVAIRLVSAPFSGPSPPLNAVTVFGSPGSASVAVQHLARCVNGLLSVAALLGVSWWLRHARPVESASHPDRDSISTESAERLPSTVSHAGPAAIATLALGLVIVVQPFLLNWQSNNEPRLAAIGIAPCALSAALWIGELEARRRSPLRWTVAGVMLALLALASLHHIYTVVGTSSNGQTVALQVLAAAGLGAALWFGAGRRESGRERGQSPPAAEILR